MTWPGINADSRLSAHAYPLFQLQIKAIPIMRRRKMISDLFPKNTWLVVEGREHIDPAGKEYRVGDSIPSYG
jgi:hypothetical protein